MAKMGPRSTDSDENNMQDVGVQRVPRQNVEPREDAHTIRSSAIRSIVVHHAHIKKEPGSYDKKCNVCRGRMGSILEAVPQEQAEVEDPVVQGDRTDEEGTTPPPPRSGWPWDQQAPH